MSGNLFNTVVFVVAVLVALLLIGLVLTRQSRRPTGAAVLELPDPRGQAVVMDGNAVQLPVLHEATTVSANTFKLEVACQEGQSPITLDGAHVDVAATFLIRVKQTAQAAGTAARTVDAQPFDPTRLKVLLEDQFVDALRTTAATTTLKALQDDRDGFFARTVQQAAAQSVEQHGLEIESVALTRVTPVAKHLNSDDALGDEPQKQSQNFEAEFPNDSSKQQESAMFVQQQNPNANPSASAAAIVKPEVNDATQIAQAEPRQAQQADQGEMMVATQKSEPQAQAGIAAWSEAEGLVATVNDAKHRLGAAQIDLSVRMQLIRALPDIVTQALKPALEQDGSIRPPQPYQVVRSIVEAVMKDAGLSNPLLGDIVQTVAQVVAPARAKGGAG